MKLTFTFRSALKALGRNKARSFLTTLGVIIGVFAVVTLISLGRGVENYITDEFENIGSNLIFVTPGDSDINGDPNKAFTRNKLDQKHVDLIESNASEFITDVSPFFIVGDTTEFKTKSFFSEIVGFTHKGAQLFNYEIDEGRHFNRNEERAASKVAVLGQEIVTELFGNLNPIGQKVKIAGETHEVIGTFKQKGANYDDQIILPFTTVLDIFEIKQYTSIVGQVNSAENVDLAMRQVELALLRDLKSQDFTVQSQQDLLDSITEILSTLTLGLGAIAGISLVVGGIGIMNIMLVTVKERIKEIGLRKALGATPTVIGAQFLIEAILLSLVGGAVGLLLGWVATLIAQQFFRAEITVSSILLAFGFSTLVGIIFGTYPAYSAGKLDPVEALNFE